jgi:DNA-binding transcriptional ArsR family regulator
MTQQEDPTPKVAQAGMSALNHPVRRQILRLLIEADKPLSPRELSKAVEKQLSGVSYHVRLLARCGAIELIRATPVRGSMQHFYSPASEFVSTPWVAVTLGVPNAGDVEAP